MNEQYGFGMDWYEGNTVNSWPALVQWDKKIRFAYFRLGIGLHADKLDLLNTCHANTMWDLGGYYEVWFPNIAKDWQLKVLLDQLKLAPFLKLPVSLAFEQQAYMGPHGMIRGWPSVGDLKYLAGKLIEAGYKTNIYTSLSGLDIIKASNLIDLRAVDWWIARSYSFPLWSSEMDISATLTYLQTKYGIQPDHVQFFQTVLDHGNSPIGGGQDFDRAVAWDFEAPPPPPTPEPIPEPDGLQQVSITVRSDRAELDSVKLVGATETFDVLSISKLTVLPFEVPQPPPPVPTPEPQPDSVRPGELMDLKIRRLEYMKIPQLTVGTFAQLGGRGQDNYLTLGRAEINFIKKWVHNADLWNWAASQMGDIYTGRDDDAQTVRWPIILMSSCVDKPRQFARVAPAVDGYRRVYGIPYQANGDYSEFTPEKYPEYFLWCPTIYPPTPAHPDGYVGWDSHNGMIFLMPIFDAVTWPDGRKSASARSYGGLVDADIFLGPHTE